MDLKTIFSKTPKASRAPLPWVGGLSAQFKQILSYIDGKQSVEDILHKAGKLSINELHKILLKLEEDGYVKRLSSHQAEPAWLNDISSYAINANNNYSIAVEEIDAAELDFDGSDFSVNTAFEIKELAEQKPDEDAKVTVDPDVERRAQEVAAIKAKLEAERIEQEKAEAIVRAKAEEEARLQAEAELKAKAEAKEKARIEAERKAQAEAAEKARLEAERIAREEAEEKARLEAERIEREKAEAIARAKAEEEARLQAEAELKAKAEAEEQARIEAERQAQAEAAEKARLEAERIVREQAEEKARIEHERKAQEELAEKARQEAEEKARLEAEHIEREKAEAIARAKAEEEARLLAEAEKAARKETKRLAKEEKAAKAKLKAEEKARAKQLRGPVMANLLASKLIKPLLISITLVLILLVGLMHVINLTMLIEPIEKLATASVGEPVKVQQVHASLFPQPHLMLTGVSVGSNEDIKIGSVNIVTAVSILFKDVKDIKSIEINSVSLMPAEFGRQAQWVNYAAKSGKLKIEQITLKQISFKVSDLEPETFNGKVTLTPSGELNNVELVNAGGNLTLLLTSQNGGAAVKLTASDWQPQLFKRLVFDEVIATGVISQNKISFSQIEAKAFGGTIKAQGELNWGGRLSTSGNFELIKMTLLRILSAYESDASVDGTLNVTAMFTSSSDQASKLMAAAEVDANFEVLTGKVNGIALSHILVAGPASKPSPDAAFTRFDTLTGNLQFKDGQYKYKQFTLKTEQFRASGNFNIEPDKTLSGKVSAELTSTSQRRQGSFTIRGDLADVKFK